MADIDIMERYYENVPYGDDSLPSQIHGPEAEKIINGEVEKYAKIHSAATKIGDNDTASNAERIIRNIYKECANAEVMKQEHTSSLRSRSNWGDYTIMDEICLEKGLPSFDEEGKLVFNVIDPRNGGVVSTTTEALSSEFHEIGDWMQPLMQAKQDLINARNDRGNPPPFDIPYFVNNLIKNNWKSMISDRTPTKDPNKGDNGYYLQEILHNAVDENGVLQEDFNTDKYSFNPEFDNRLFTVVSNELHRAFNPNYKSSKDVSNSTAGDETVSEEKTEAENLMSRMNTEQTA